MIALASAIKARIAAGSVSAQFRLALGLDPGIAESSFDPRHSGSRRPGGIGGWCAAADGLHAGLVWPPLRSPTSRPIASYTLHLGQLRGHCGALCGRFVAAPPLLRAFVVLGRHDASLSLFLLLSFPFGYGPFDRARA